MRTKRDADYCFVLNQRKRNWKESKAKGRKKMEGGIYYDMYFAWEAGNMEIFLAYFKAIFKRNRMVYESLL